MKSIIKQLKELKEGACTCSKTFGACFSCGLFNQAIAIVKAGRDEMDNRTKKVELPDGSNLTVVWIKDIDKIVGKQKGSTACIEPSASSLGGSRRKPTSLPNADEIIGGKE